MLARRHALGDVGEVRDEILHLAAVRGKTGAGAAAREAVVDAVLDRNDGVDPIDIPRIPRHHAGQRRRVGTAAFVEMTARAIQRAWRVRRQTVVRMRENRQPTICLLYTSPSPRD